MTIVCAAIEWLLSTTLSTVHGRLREFASARQSRARPRRELPFSTHTGQPVFSKAAVRTGANYLLGPAPPLLL
jgi:hypothetical protein